MTEFVWNGDGGLAMGLLALGSRNYHEHEEQIRLHQGGTRERILLKVCLSPWKTVYLLRFYVNN